MTTVLLTGATGLLGRETLVRLLRAEPSQHFHVLVRDAARWAIVAQSIPGAHGRVTALVGDITVDGLGLSPNVRRPLRGRVTGIIHLAADTVFSRALIDARATNTEGTRRLLELANDIAPEARFAYVSTAFVAGRRTGLVREDVLPADAGWVNAYEQSKWEAEALVRAHTANWLVLRCSTIVCDDTRGAVTQFNAVHRALRLYRDGLAAMMPGVDGSTLDAVTADYVAGGIARLALRDEVAHRTFQLCAGAGAMSLTDLLDTTYERWATDAAWRRRGIPRPAIADLATYELFERTVEATADPSLRRVTRALSHFVPQLALPKQFDTTNTDATLGYIAPSVRSYWTAMVDQLLAADWWGRARAA